MIARENQFIFDLLKAGLTGCNVSLPKAVDWDKVGRELEVQTVAALPAEVISRLPVAEEVEARWKRISYMHFARWSQIMYAQDKILKLMERNRIPAVILKGTAAAMYYPIPQYRSMGDIDFLVLDRDYERAMKWMLEDGYVLIEQENYHSTLERYGVIFEIHKELAKIADDVSGRALMQYVWSGFKQREWHSFEEYRVPVMSWQANGLVLLHHIRQHLRGGLGLRQMVDWMMYVKKELHDERYPWFHVAVKKTGLEPLAICVTRMCQLFLGLPEEGITWCARADENVCRELMAYVMEQGNFGQKIGAAGKGTKALNRHRNGIQLIQWMQRQGVKHWELAQEHPFLRHFAVVHEGFWYISYIFHREKPFRTLCRDIKASKRRRRLFKVLSS